MRTKNSSLNTLRTSNSRDMLLLMKKFGINPRFTNPAKIYKRPVVVQVDEPPVDEELKEAFKDCFSPVNLFIMNHYTDFGLIGLAVMGQNLALNIADHGYKISVYNRTFSKTEDFLARNAYSNNISGFANIQEFVASIKQPRKIIIMVQAGEATDAVIDMLVPFLDAEDILIDGGNAKWTDTIRRESMLKDQNLHFVGSGVSGGGKVLDSGLP